MSKAFEKYDEFRKAISGIEGVSISKFSDSTRDPHDKIFYINSKDTNESVAMTVSFNGVLKSATYIDKEITDGKRTKFLGKDFDKLKEASRSESLSAAAALYDWSMAPKKEGTVEEPEVEEAEPEPEFE